MSNVLKKYKTTDQLIPNSVVEEGFFGVLRSEDYKRGKVYHDREVLKLENAMLWCKISTECVVGDMNVTAGDFEGVMKKLENIAAKLGIRQIQFHASPGTQLYALFAKKYKSTPSFPALFQQFDERIDIEKIKFTMADIDIF